MSNKNNWIQRQIITVLSCLTSIYHITNAQGLENSLGQSSSATRNINHTDGVKFQDTKRSKVHLSFTYHVEGEKNTSKSTEVLINNSLQNTSPMILTAAHIISLFPADARNITGYLTPNYEMADASLRGTKEKHAFITQSYFFEAKLIVREEQHTDIALLQITNIDVNALNNVFAAG
jgi:hypothetical protein